MSRFLKIFFSCLLLFGIYSVDAAVTTHNRYPEKGNGVYIVGNTDLYPIEFYNEKSKSFEGVLPQLLEKISKQTGFDFIYIYNGDVNRGKLVDDIKPDMIAYYSVKDQSLSGPDTAIVMSYEHDGVVANVGWKFTQYADPATVTAIRAEAEKISVSETNALLMKYSRKEKGRELWWNFVIALCGVIMIIVFIFILRAYKRIKENIRRKELADSVTGIGNLVYFEKCFAGLGEELKFIAYFILDSNYLQLSYSESTFVDAIKYVADTLNSQASNGEIVARITENGFVYVFRSDSEKDAEEYIEEITEQLLYYFEGNGRDDKLFFRAVAYRLNDEDRNCELLLFNLRQNCSKLMSTNQVFTMCSNEMMNSAFERKQFLDRIERGFKEKEFKLYLQFIMDNRTRKIESAEALSRWECGEDGVLAPAKYINVMEEAGIITTLDYYMFEQTCVQLHKWKGTEFEDIGISCNFTRITISEKNFTEKIEDISSRYIFDRNKLIIEITEDALEKNKEVAVKNILNCKKKGFRIALDDLGSGYTSLVNLCDYPIDIVKIDRSILTKTESKSGQDLLAGIISLAHNLGLKVVCEGVETEEQHKYISSSECDYVQGWYYSKVLPIKDSEELWRNFFSGAFTVTES